MNNIEKIFLYIIIVAPTLHNYSYAGLKEGVQGIFPGVGVAGAQEINKLLKEHLPGVEKTAQTITQVAGDSAVEACAKVGIESVKEMASVGHAGVAVL